MPTTHTFTSRKGQVSLGRNSTARPGQVIILAFESTNPDYVNKICARRSYQSDQIKINVDKEKLSVRIRCHAADASKATEVAKDMIRKLNSTSQEAGEVPRPSPQQTQPVKAFQEPAKAFQEPASKPSNTQPKSFASVTKFAPAGLKPAPASPDMEAFRKATPIQRHQQQKNTSFVKMTGANYEPVEDEEEDPWMTEMEFNIINFRNASEAREAEIRQFLEFEMGTDFDYGSMEPLGVPYDDGLPWNAEGASGDEIFA